VSYAILPRLAGSGPWPAAPVVGVLGARHLIQAALTRSRPTHTTLMLGAGADAAHAASMVLLGTASRRWRAAALADAALAAALAVAGLACARDEARRARPGADRNHTSNHRKDMT
jgi:uncharacterized membrane protein YebE (DUF533 family)